jgi:diguanylate cyclase (GGDEF)-like protein
VNSQQSHHVLLIENEKGRYKAEAAVLAQAGYSVLSVRPATLEQLGEHLATARPDIVLYCKGENMPALESVTALLSDDLDEIPVIVITGKLTKGIVSVAENSGANAVVQKGRPESLLRTVKKALRSASLQRRVSRLENEFEVIQLQHRVNELENTLREKEARCLALTEDCRNAIAYVHEGMHIYANSSYTRLLGFDNDDEIIGTSLLNWTDPHHHELLTMLLKNPFASQDITSIKVRLLQNDAEPLETDMEISAVKFGNKLCTQITVRAFAEPEIAESPPDILVHHDLVTGLFNRQYFMKALEEKITTREKPGKFQAITFILIDNFKEIRERIGITASDDLITEIAELIREVYGHENTVARFGDYTFTILNNYSYKEGAFQLAETLRNRIEKYTLNVGSETASTTSSIGICVINEHVKDAENAHSRADLACELARTSGGNQIHVHSTTIDAQIDHEVEEKMHDMVRKTIDDDRFYLVYQPVISLNGKAGGHYEVLLRVLDEENQVILPGEFLSLAEKSPMIIEIDRRVIQLAFKALADKQQEEEHTSFFIKLSGETLVDPKLPGWIGLLLQQFNLKGESVIFEIAESLVTGKLQETQEFVKAMQAIDCKVTIEHFGYARNPEIIRHLSVDFLKIDGSLINNLASSKDNQQKVKDIVDLARNSNTLCIAEHVDDPHCLVMLWQYNIDYIQGNLVQEPDKELTHDFEDDAALAGIIETDNN